MREGVREGVSGEITPDGSLLVGGRPPWGVDSWGSFSTTLPTHGYRGTSGRRGFLSLRFVSGAKIEPGNPTRLTIGTPTPRRGTVRPVPLSVPDPNLHTLPTPRRYISTGLGFSSVPTFTFERLRSEGSTLDSFFLPVLNLLFIPLDQTTYSTSSQSSLFGHYQLFTLLLSVLVELTHRDPWLRTDDISLYLSTKCRTKLTFLWFLVSSMFYTVSV